MVAEDQFEYYVNRKMRIIYSPHRSFSKPPFLFYYSTGQGKRFTRLNACTRLIDVTLLILL
jgi:hypothetical protein